MPPSARFTITPGVQLGLVVASFTLAAGPQACAQCYGGTLYPSNTITVPDDGTVATISTTSFAGDRAQVSLLAGRTYRFTSSTSSDHITVSTASATGAQVWGTTPVHFTATSSQVYHVHFHTNAACGTQFVARTTTVFRSHCQAGAVNCGGGDEAITRVTIGSIDNASSGCWAGGYSDYSHLAATIMAGGSLPIQVRNLNAFSGDLVRVYVDWDRNFQFDDAGGSFLLSTSDHITFHGIISAPPGTAAGPVRMRVRLNFMDDGAQCGNGQYGEVEDYTLQVAVFGGGLYAGGAGRGEARGAWQTPAWVAVRYQGGQGRGEASRKAPSTPRVQLNARAFLEGPYAAATGLMNDALRGLAGFPLQEPYTVLGYAHAGGGGESITPALLGTAGNNAIVDWVVVELRNNASPGIIVASRAGLLQRDGDIVDTDGISPLGFHLAAGSYRVAVRHRNHLGIMTASGIALSASPTNIDLGLAGTATFGINARKPITGTVPKQVLWAGDVSFNGEVKYAGSGNDRDPILTTVGGSVPTNTITGYGQADVNLDGQVKYAGSGNDRDPILENIGGGTPTATRNAQLP